MLPLSVLENQVIDSDPEYFKKIKSARIRTAIRDTLHILPLPCPGEKMDVEICNIRDDLDLIGEEKKLRFYQSYEELIKALSERVKKTLESDRFK